MQKFINKKVVPFWTILSLLINSLSPITLLVPQVAHAQEATVTQSPTDQPTSDPTPSDTTPTDPAVSPTQDPTPVDTTVSPTPDPTVTEDTTPAPTTDNSSSSSNSNSTGSNSSSPKSDSTTTTPTDTATIAPSPTTDPAKDVEKGDVHVTILDKVSAPSLDLTSTSSETSAVLSTDKADYAPTDTAIISGTSLLPNTPYTLYVSSTDPPPVNFSTNITTNDQGGFIYAYQLDGKYRPNYAVVVKDGEGNTVASTTFTDSDPQCNKDAQGADDQPGQKDLTNMCVTYGSTNDTVSWNWDDISFSGNNTGDACSLYDTDNDGFANYSICVGVNGNPAAKVYTKVYSCGDSSSEKCTQAITEITPFTSSCTAGVVSASNPFDSGSDTVAQCTVQHADMGGLSPRLLDVCSYPSGQPNSDPSDCIIASTASQTGAIELKKVWSGTPGQTTLNIGTSINGTEIASVQTGVDGAEPLTTGIKTISTGTFYMSETGGLTNYTSSLACTKNGQAYTVGANGSVIVANNEVFVCTFTNTRINNGTITIVKDANPNSAQSFGFTTTGGLSPSTFNLVDNGGTNSTTYSSLAPGTYTVTEGATAGWDLTNLTCIDPTNNSTVNASTATINLAAGESVTCTYTNTNKGHLIVQKTTLPSGDTTNFSINASGSGTITGSASATVTDATDKDYEVTPGTYSVTETVPAGWDKTGDTCQNIVVAAGQTATCLLTNTKRGSVTVTKFQDHDANGTKDTGDEVLQGWDITLSGNTKTTDANGSVSYTNLVPGNFTLSETIKSTWHQSNISCTNDTGIDNDNSHSVTVDPGANVVCVIGNFQNASLKVTKKVVNPDGVDLKDTSTLFHFTVDNIGTNPDLTDDQSQTFSVVPGTHTVVETPNANYDFAGCTPPTGLSVTNGTAITITSGQSAEIICTNKQKKASITVTKDVLKSDGSAVSDTHGFQVTLNGVTKSFAEGTNAVFSVNPGTYSATETTDNDYTLFSNDSPKTVASNGSATINIVNKQKPGTISGYKYKADGQTGILGWTINLLTCDSGFITCSAFASTTTDTSGFFSFSNLVTGFYKVAEYLDPLFTPVGQTTHNVTVTTNSTSTNNNFSNFKNVNVTACKKVDADGSLTTSNDQTNKTGWSVNLLVDGQASGSAKSTGDNGCYTWSNLGPNHTYGVSEDAVTGWTALTDNTHDFGTAQDGVNQSYTFINFNNVTVSGQKFNDLNGNGIKNAGENGLQGWTIFIDTNGNGVLDQGEASAVTDSSGNYSFTGLTGGTYKIREVAQTGWTQTSTNPADISVTSGTNVTGVDFGNQGRGTVTVTKYLDENANGIQDEGEDVLSNWTINLAGQVSLVTGVNGQVVFSDVPAGSHNLSENLTQGWLQSNISCTDDNGIDNDNSHGLTVEPGGTINCAIGNYQQAHIFVKKDVVNPDGDPIDDTTPSFDFNVRQNGDVIKNFSLKDGGESNDIAVKPGTYNVNEVLNNSDYSFDKCSAVYDGESVGRQVSTDQESGEEVSLDSGDTVTVTCVNKQKTAKVTGYKWNDADSDGKLTCTESNESSDCEEKLSGWTIFADTNSNGALDAGEVSTTTDQSGNYTLNLNPGSYLICEVLQTGWAQTYPGNQEKAECHDVKLTSNEDHEGSLNFGNVLLVPVLTIAKTNNQIGNDLNPGAQVMYTLTVTATQSAVKDVKVVDLLPKGFVYQGGSWTATSSERGDLKSEGTTTEPTYHSPGTWKLGDMIIGETVTLTLFANIDGGEKSGLYKDLATAQGTSLVASPVQANSDTGVFVGTAVNVVNGEVQGASIKVNQTQEVLGASTVAEGLPETGAKTFWMYIAGAFLIFGFGSVVIGYYLRRRYNA